jgi:bifunctional non-homologous end joining protein LigD
VPDREPQPTFVPPMLLTAGEVPGGDRWSLELKWDGCRAQLRHDRHAVTLRTRHGRECSADFPELAQVAGVLGRRQVTLDGELVCLRPDGRPDFARLRRRLTGSVANRDPAMFQVFDILHLDGRSTRALPYRERRALLAELLLDGPAWRTPASVVVDEPAEFLAQVAELELEGVVAKRLDSSYLPGRRTRAWIKQKVRREEQLVVTGVRRTTDGWVDAVFVARRRADGSLVAAGSIELGLTREFVVLLEECLAGQPLRRRGAVAWYSPGVSVIASVHGPSDGPVRDAMLLQVMPGDHEPLPLKSPLV